MHTMHHIRNCAKYAIPENGTTSAKFLPRMGKEWDGKAIFIDDQQPDADNIEYMKICNAGGTIRPTYGTLDKTNTPQIFDLPMRLTYIVAKVDTSWGADAEQIQSRIIPVYLDESEKQQARIRELMMKKMRVDYVDNHTARAAYMRTELWKHLPTEIYADTWDIDGHIWVNKIDNRMYEHLLNMIACYAVYRQWTGTEEEWTAKGGTWKSEEKHEPIIYPQKEDATAVIDMFNSFLTIPGTDHDGADPNAGGNVYKFSKAEKRVHDAILERYQGYQKEWSSVREMADDLGINRETVRIAVNGRRPTVNTEATNGLLNKMPGRDMVRETKTIESGVANSTLRDTQANTDLLNMVKEEGPEKPDPTM